MFENLSLTPQHIVLIGLFFGVLLAFEGLRQILSGEARNEDTRVRRIKMIRDGRTPEESLQLLRAPETKSPLQRIPLIGTLPQQLRQAGITMPAQLFLMISGLLVLFAYMVLSQLFGAIMAVPFAIGAGLGLPISVVKHLRQKRMNAFIAQLPDALDLMMRGLRVGHPLSVTFGSVAQMMEDPIASEFATMADQVAYGDEIIDALFDMAERIDQEDVHYLAVAVAIQHGTGGNLAAMLGTLSQTVRDRAMMRRRVRALSSEGRMSAFFLSALPVFIYAMTSITSPDYFGEVKDDPAFVPIAVIIVSLVLGNFFALRKLVNFKI